MHTTIENTAPKPSSGDDLPLWVFVATKLICARLAATVCDLDSGQCPLLVTCQCLWTRRAFNRASQVRSRLAKGKEC